MVVEKIITGDSPFVHLACVWLGDSLGPSLFSRLGPTHIVFDYRNEMSPTQFFIWLEGFKGAVWMSTSLTLATITRGPYLSSSFIFYFFLHLILFLLPSTGTPSLPRLVPLRHLAPTLRRSATSPSCCSAGCAHPAATQCSSTVVLFLHRRATAPRATLFLPAPLLFHAVPLLHRPSLPCPRSAELLLRRLRSSRCHALLLHAFPSPAPR
jgi:hypothetical protein